MTTAAEITTFRQIAATTSDAMLAALKSLDGFLSSQPGFQGRYISRDEAGGWTDYVVWADMASGQAASAKFMDQPEAPGVVALIEEGSLSMRHETLVS